MPEFFLPDPTEFSVPDMQWGWRLCRPDLLSSHGYTWPLPGNWAYPNEGHSSPLTGDACPAFDGDGLCIARTFAGAASSGMRVGSSAGLIVGYFAGDVLGSDDHKVRVSVAWVAGLMDVVGEIARPGAYLTDAYLTGANLTGANLTRANLTDANLTDAYLAGANLTGANLTGANLTRANLADANLTRAYLTRAYLTGANLAGAYLAGAYGDRFTVLPSGWRVADSGLIVHA